jgi:phosphatidylglycerol lysyltransferase
VNRTAIVARDARLVYRRAAFAEQLATLQGTWRWFHAEGVEGVVPYRARFGVAIVPGDPLCAEAVQPRLLAAFLTACRNARWYALFVPASPRLAEIAPVAGCAVWKIGEEPIIDLEKWSLAGRRAAALRAALNHARRVGVTTLEVSVVDAEAMLGEVESGWRGRRRGPALGFVLASSPLAPLARRRWFAARTTEGIAAFAVTAPLLAGEGVAVEHFVRGPDAPRGAMEAAIVAALSAHAGERVRWATLGAAPFRGSDIQSMPTWADPRRRLGAEAMLLAWRRAARSYHASSLEQFKRKFPVDRWEPLFAVNFPAAVRPRLGAGLALELLPGGPRVWLGAAHRVVNERLRSRLEGR